jgi:methylated-DNA-[protein]-cysteine S-methyltransferase
MKSIFATHYATFETVAGVCSVAWNDDAISCFQLPSSKPEDIELWRKRRVPHASRAAPHSRVRPLIDEAIRYFGGEVIDFMDTPIDLRGQSEFFVAIYGALRRVPYGQTTTYGELARSIGSGAERSREVGVAMAVNPLPLIIPCHRVLAAGGRLSGFSAPGGKEAKAWMLRLGGVAVECSLATREPSGAQTSFAF